LADLSIVFVSYNTAEMTCKAIRLVKESLHTLDIEIFVVDNASKDDSSSRVSAEFPDVHLITNSTNVGFGRANNQVLKHYKGQYLLLLNTDAFVEPNTIQTTYSFMQSNPKTGILGVRLLGRDGVLQPSCRYFPTPLNIFLTSTGLFKLFPTVQLVDDMKWSHNALRNCDWVPGCYYLIKREVIEQVGLFDPRYFLYYEEVDHCFATKKAGWDVTYFPDASVVHIGGESAKTDNKISAVSKQVSALQIESELLYFRKNLGLSAVLLHIMLSTISELIILVKKILKKPAHFNVSATFKTIWLFSKLSYMTRFGSRNLR
jgi:N-acetylglucosaminyl-diphospho-decaprenol L-rhamnosyltransferase